ncbi:sigma-70 family RNA polymerase sigma factor [Prevotella veroralis]|uniref:sigma-70 family RNA polymerase sigma factor n=1 Tax=Prevotella veroralis TaxID=28137 RepID=UPI00035D2352|nr:sigma-70 family RNA polymerase sigma factor [Prevotella veroralis]
MSVNEKYIEEIVQEQLLSNEEEQALAAKIKLGDAKALEKLTKANLKFVVSLAHHYKNQGLGEDDLVSEGNIGMMHAAQKFDGTKGIRFVSYAAPYIKKAMEEAIKEQTALYKLPKDEKSKFERKRTHAISIDQPIPVGSSNNFTLQHVLENEDAPQADEHLNKELLNFEIQKGLNELNEREKRIIIAIYGLNGTHYTMAEIAENMGLKRERVRQIRNKALRKLHKKMK